MAYFFMVVGAGGILGNFITDVFLGGTFDELGATRGIILISAGGIIRAVDKLRDVMKGNRNGY